MAKKSTKKTPPKELPLGDEPGVGRVSIPELDEAAASYNRIKKRRMELTDKEVEAKDTLINLMRAHEADLGRAADGGLHYIYDDDDSSTGRSEVALLPTDEQLKIRAFKDPGAPE